MCKNYRSSPGDLTIARGGVLPNINPMLLPKKTEKAAAASNTPSKATKSPKEV
ncbi:histone H2A [Medicago truncatula]|uniref:Histone H2A n=1 Tax=Medicago truncatula TaxID=3880 RepID=G7IHN2_MEDTR|nr:histone H2A [Medicago truncatula]